MQKELDELLVNIMYGRIKKNEAVQKIVDLFSRYQPLESIAGTYMSGNATEALLTALNQTDLSTLKELFISTRPDVDTATTASLICGLNPNNLSSLESLSIVAHLKDEGLQQVSPLFVRLTKLKVLKLPVNDLTPESVKLVAATVSKMPYLTVIDLSSNEMTGASAAMMIETCRHRPLKELSLSLGNNKLDAIIATLEKEPGSLQIEKLMLDFYGQDLETESALAKAWAHQKIGMIGRLDFSASIPYLKDFKQITAIGVVFDDELHIQQPNTYREILELFTTLTQCPHIKTLDLSYIHYEDRTDIDEDDQVEICPLISAILPMLPTITTLSLRKNDLGDSDLNQFIEILPDCELRQLSLAKTLISRDGIEALSKVLNQSKLTRLDLSENYFHGCDFSSFADALAENTRLKILDLRFCELDASAINNLSKALMENNTLVELYLDDKYLVGHPEITEKLEQNRLLQSESHDRRSPVLQHGIFKDKTNLSLKTQQVSAEKGPDAPDQEKP